VLAYSCEPGSGSESGAGWIWSRMLARIAEVWVVTRANNRRAIEGVLADVPERDHLRFVYVDLPEWARFWKKGPRGARLYYMLWQGRVLREARRVDSEVGFDLVWHLTMSTVWLGSLLPLMGRPFVYGPVGGGVGTPWRLARVLGARGILYEVGRTLARAIGRHVNPISRMAWRRAKLILVQNPETREWLPPAIRSRAEVFPHIVLEPAVLASPSARRDAAAEDDGPVALYVGRLLSWKGLSLAIHALALLPQWSLLVCGTGPDEKRLRDIASRAGVADRVIFLGWVPRDHVLKLMQDRSDVFLFPSLHDEGGWVIAEALASRLPVVCLDWGGPSVLAGGGVPVGTVDSTVSALAEAVKRSLVTAAVSPSPPMFDEATRRLAELLSRRLGIEALPTGGSEMASG